LLALAEEGDRVFEYVYDYGDNWRIALVIEALQLFRVSSIHASSKVRVVDHPKTLADPGAIPSSSKQSPILTTSSMLNSASGAAAISIRPTSRSTISIKRSPNSQSRRSRDRKNPPRPQKSVSIEKTAVVT
jgi:hypothetical protein